LGDDNCGKTSIQPHINFVKKQQRLLKKKRKRRNFKNKSMCVLLLKLSSLHVCGKSIEAEIKKRVDLRMNALLEPKFCILEKP